MSAKEFLKATSPNNEFGLRAELNKHRLRRLVEKEMEAYLKSKVEAEIEKYNKILDNKTHLTVEESYLIVEKIETLRQLLKQ